MPADPELPVLPDRAGESRPTKVHDDDLVLAFRDIAPRSPTHILVIPKDHIASAADLTEAHGPLLGRLFADAAEHRPREGIADAGYRLVSERRPLGRPTVDHLHVHLMGGRAFEWPPG